MKKIKKSDYDKTIKYILETIETFPKHLRPICMVQNGHITEPGISDIDLLIGFNDEFIFAQEFTLRFMSSLIKLHHSEVYFHHLPYMYPISLLKQIPTLTLNPVGKLKIIYGTSPFKINDFLSPEQNILNSFEQLHNRIVMLSKLLFSKEINIKQVLLIGHSLIHSLNSVRKIGVNLKKNEFQEFLFIENIRQEIGNNGSIRKISEERCREICKNLCSEFFKILNVIYFYLDSKTCVHFSNSGNFHRFHQFVIFENLYAHRNNKLDIKSKDKKIYINGFSWHLKCIFENYFLDESEFKTIFFDKPFQEAVKDRAKFIKKLTYFNYKNFGNAYGRGGFNPLVTGKEYNIYGIQSIRKI